MVRVMAATTTVGAVLSEAASAMATAATATATVMAKRAAAHAWHAVALHEALQNISAPESHEATARDVPDERERSRRRAEDDDDDDDAEEDEEDEGEAAGEGSSPVLLRANSALRGMRLCDRSPSPGLRSPRSLRLSRLPSSFFLPQPLLLLLLLEPLLLLLLSLLRLSLPLSLLSVVSPFARFMAGVRSHSRSRSRSPRPSRASLFSCFFSPWP